LIVGLRGFWRIVSVWWIQTTLHGTGLQIEGVLAYFTHLKCQKRIEDTFLPTKKKICENDLLVCLIQLIMQEYDSKCLKYQCILLP
jgi:hypothetical protein